MITYTIVNGGSLPPLTIPILIVGEGVLIVLLRGANHFSLIKGDQDRQTDRQTDSDAIFTHNGSIIMPHLQLKNTLR